MPHPEFYLGKGAGEWGEEYQHKGSVLLTRFY